MRKLLAGVAIGLAMSGSALAADLPVKAVPLAPVVVNDWSGLYAGVEVGVKWTQNDWSSTCFGLQGVLCPTLAPGVAANPFFPDGSSPHRFTDAGIRAGGYVGFNWQFAPQWLVGVELDLAWYDRTSQVAGLVGCTFNCGFRTTPVNPADVTRIRTLGDGAARARFGFLPRPDLLLYASGGLAGEWLDPAMVCGPGVWCTFGRSQIKGQGVAGWTAGAGIEWKKDRWIFRGEYRYVEFNNITTSFFNQTGDDVFVTIKPRAQIATVGLAYQFWAK